MGLLNDSINSNTFPRKTSTRAEGGSLADWKHVFQDNTTHYKTILSIFRLMWMAYNNNILFLLTAAAIVLLAIGYYQDFSTTSGPTNPGYSRWRGCDHNGCHYYRGHRDYERLWEATFSKLDRKKHDQEVKVTRLGKSRLIPIFDVLVRDIVHLEPGDVIPADRILIDGCNIKYDKSSVLGESRLIHKSTVDEVFCYLGSNTRIELGRLL